MADVFHRGHVRYLSHKESPGTTFVAPGLLSLRGGYRSVAVFSWTSLSKAK